MLDIHNITFGRKEHIDERDTQYTIQRLMSIKPPDIRRVHRYWWAQGWWGNQQQTPQCVAYSWLHWAEDGPLTQAPHTPNTEPRHAPQLVYDLAQAKDPWPGNNYDGTTVRAGAKAMQELGYIQSYWWAWDINTLIDTVLNMGPVVVGTNWTQDMFYPKPEENYVIKPTGRQVGGHAYVINGVSHAKKILRIKNSWGRQWGKEGFAYISFADMDNLIKQGGEICVAIEEALPL